MSLAPCSSRQSRHRRHCASLCGAATAGRGLLAHPLLGPFDRDRVIARVAILVIGRPLSQRLLGDLRYPDDLTEEVDHWAADRHGRVVTIGQLVLFSTETDDAWLLDPSDQLAARLARDGDPEPVHIEQNDTSFFIDWKGNYRIEGPPSSIPIARPSASQPSSDTPSRPGEFHPEPLTEPDVRTLASSGSCHSTKAGAFRRDSWVPPVSR